jgi:hypothetical protein
MPISGTRTNRRSTLVGVRAAIVLVMLVELCTLVSGAACGSVLNLPEEAPRIDASIEAASGEGSANDAPNDGATTDASPVSEGGCTDGSVCDPCAECASHHCTAPDQCDPLVFLSTSTVNGGVLGASGGVAGVRADKLCEADAVAMGLESPTSFHGWLDNPQARGLRLVERPYWTPALAGARLQIAPKASALALALTNRIARLDGSTPITVAWTDLLADGGASPSMPTCANWQDPSPGAIGTAGESDSTSPGVWAAHPYVSPSGWFAISCQPDHSIYCFQDVAP